MREESVLELSHDFIVRRNQHLLVGQEVSLTLLLGMTG